jgi:hypothetical protein
VLLFEGTNGLLLIRFEEVSSVEAGGIGEGKTVAEL